MAYVKNIWVDQDVERPKTYEVTENQDGSITLTDSFGIVTELGTPVNETNMNHIEDGIDGCAIRKHNLTETFNLGEWVLGGTGDNEGIYKSLVANNLGNAVTDGTKWEKVKLGGSTRNLGEIITSTLPLTDAGLHLLDGALLDGDGVYKGFVDYISDLYGEDPTANYFTTEVEWQARYAANGACGKFVYDTVNNTVRLPKIQGFTESTTALNELGDLIEAGLPNITGRVGAYSSSTVGVIRSNYTLGAFGYGESRSQTTNNSGSSADDSAFAYADFNASRSSTIYGNSTTVQPQAIKVLYYIVVATSPKTDLQVDIDEIATDLNGKADVDGTNMVSSVKNFDGQWVPINIQIANNVQWDSSTAEATYDLSSYLPDDEYKYEVYLTGFVQTTNTTNKFVTIQVSSDIISGVYMASARTVANYAATSHGNCTIAVGSARAITQYTNDSPNAGGVYSIGLKGYRRIGTNA